MITLLSKFGFLLVFLLLKSGVLLFFMPKMEMSSSEMKILAILAIPGV